MKIRDHSERSLLKNFRFILRLVWQTSPRFMLVKLMNVATRTASPFIFIIFPKYILDAAIDKRADDALRYILAMCGCHLLVSMLSSVADVLYEKYTPIMQFELTKAYSKKLMSLNYEDIENPKILDMYQKSESGFSLYGFFDKTFNLLSNILALVGYFAILFTYSRLMLVVVAIVVAVNLLCTRRKNKYYYKLKEDFAPINRKLNYLSDTMKSFDYAKEIKVNRLEEFITRKFDNCVSDAFKMLSRVYVKLGTVYGVTSLTAVLQNLALYASVTYSTIRGSITVGDFSMYITSISAASTCLLSIVTSLGDIVQNMKFATDMRLFFEMERRVEYGGETPKLDGGHFSLEFRGVSFRYPGSEKFAIRNMSFTVRDGEKISIVGKNGSGKTTTIKLLLRLYEPTEGEILLCGRNIRDYDYGEYLELFAPVLQDYKVFAFSCRENIVFDRPFDVERFERAIADSGLGEKIAALPQKDLTSIYRRFDENGVEFSGGENQRLAIARAIYKASPIILLDEPTANLDPIAEYDIYMTIYRMLGDKTSFFVSHRLASCRFCDRIFVIDEGELVADAEHDELMRTCGIYREMFERQAEYYR